ncbi:hypothetical protein [Kitasatospora viridis]|uniref:CDP-glycerol:poly(Glycerophosphate) glycerophosphotransferase n=1 Tax=Kitasatospora viridis TaxID=281105 RepID=A0A561UN86_9ACTN|nr:hypothetical protein [Kitasatospora viridis]TWG00820.1 hypothetical protein FHX73_114700 [Kitasatospora viridis]
MSSDQQQRSGPVRRDPGQWGTLPDCKRVLVVIHSTVYGRRLQDLLPVFRADLRVSVQFTVAPHAFNSGVEAVLADLGGTALPWEEACRTRFDLILTAGSQGMEQLTGPVVRLPHGAGHIKLSRPQDTADRTVGGFGRRYLTWQGKVVPVAFAVAHDEDLAAVARWCPEALPITEVVGDASYDRIALGLGQRGAHRAALGLREDERLVLVSSTWGLGSAFNRLDSLLPRLLTELPGYRVALLVHPNVWAGHGAWQVRSWLADALGDRIVLVPPQHDWRPVLIAADFVIGDHGSVTLYGTMTDAPILISRYPFRSVNQDSPGAQLARTAPALSPSRPLAEQLDYAAERYRAADYRKIAARISSRPGSFNQGIRELLYRVLELGEPAHRPQTEPLALPEPLVHRGPR